MGNVACTKISIIVASLNSEGSIEKSIRSLLNQNYQNLEIIFVDGGSRDKTIEIIKSFNLKNSILISERDCGIGDAWNKGLRASSGGIIGILNSDDYLEDDMLSKVERQLVISDQPLIGFGDVTLINPVDGTRKKIVGKSRGKFGLLNGFGFLHPSVFFNRKALEAVGEFNQRINVAVDTDWLLRAMSKKVAFVKIASHVYMVRGGHSDKNKYTAMGEYLDALVRNGYSNAYVVVFFALRTLGSLLRLIKY